MKNKKKRVAVKLHCGLMNITPLICQETIQLNTKMDTEKQNTLVIGWRIGQLALHTHR